MVSLLEGISSMLSALVGVGVLLIALRVVISRARPKGRDPAVRLLHQATDPLLGRITAAVHTVHWNLDFAPMMGIAVLVSIDRTAQCVIWKIVESIG